MRRLDAGNITLAAIICLAPGGFLLGFALAARYYREKGKGQGAASERPLSADPRADGDRSRAG